MSFVEALPAFKLRQWQAIVLMFLDAFSVRRLPSLTQHLANIDVLLHKVKCHHHSSFSCASVAYPLLLVATILFKLLPKFKTSYLLVLVFFF